MIDDIISLDGCDFASSLFKISTHTQDLKDNQV